MELLFRAYTKNTTTALGVLTDATEKRISRHYNGPGTGAFRINRHSSQFAWCAPGNYVRVYIDSTSNDPIFAFFIESGSDQVVSRNEQGGQVVQRGGRGTMAYLERAIIDNSSTFGRYAADSLTWSWTDATHGQIVKEIIDDAQARGGLSLLTYDFTNTTESGGGTWETISGTYELPVGLDLLQALQRQQSAGLVASMSPSFVLSASEVVGSDLSGSITFEAGVNISEEVTREVLASAAKSRMLVQGTTVAGTPFFRWVADATVETALGDRREGFVSYQATTDSATLIRVGQQAIRRLKRRHDGLSVLGVMTDEFVPFTDYLPGDTVTINVPGVWSNLAAPITSIVLFDVEDGEADCALEFEDIAFEPLQLRDRTDADPSTGGGGGTGGGSGGTGSGGGGGAGGGSGCGGCPPFVFGEMTAEGHFYDYFGRGETVSTINPLTGGYGGWLNPSTSGHDYDGPNIGSFQSGSYGAIRGTGASAVQASDLDVAELQDLRFRIEIDFAMHPDNVSEFTGDTSHAISPSLTGAGLGVRLEQSANPAIQLTASAFASSGTFSWTYDVVEAINEVSIGGVAGTTSSAGSMTLGLDRNVYIFMGGSGACCHISRIQTYTFGAPSSGQQVYNEPVGTGDGTTVTFTTAYPWRPGGIIVRINGIDVTDSVASFDPTTGDITFAHAPATGSEITVTYVAA